jgi:hypothetical protein
METKNSKPISFAVILLFNCVFSEHILASSFVTTKSFWNRTEHTEYLPLLLPALLSGELTFSKLSRNLLDG